MKYKPAIHNNNKLVIKNRFSRVLLSILICGGLILSPFSCIFSVASILETSGLTDEKSADEISENSTKVTNTNTNTDTIAVTIPENYEELKLYAQSAVLIDGDTNRILYAKNADVHMANASTTKILTCILAIESGQMDQVCEVSDYARSMPETKCGFYEGDSFYLKDLLYSLMLESHNDSAVVIAEAIGGSVEGFAELMNEKAKELGCTNTYFITPNGLDAEDENGTHGTSAYDLALIMNYCRQNETFLEITRTSEYSFSDVDKNHTYAVSNKNSFLSLQSGALTGKTGYTSKAGYCYVCAYQENGRNYSLALLACGWPNHKTYKWQDSKALISYGNQYYDIEMIGNTEELYEVSIPEGIRMDGDSFDYCQETTLVSDGTQWEMLIGENDQVTTEILCNSPQLPIIDNASAGVVKYYINGVYAGEQELFYTENVYEQDISWCISYFMKEFLQMASF